MKPRHKASLTHLLVQVAVSHLQQAREARASSRIEDEVAASIGAHLVLGVAVEGVGNEIGEDRFDKAFLSEYERANATMKWYLLSTLDQRKPFDFSREPLQTVKQLSSVRNAIAHPKVKSVELDLILVRSGSIIRDIEPDAPVGPGDSLVVGYGKLYDEYNYRTAATRLKAFLSAVEVLLRHLETTDQLRWVAYMKKQAEDQFAP